MAQKVMIIPSINRSTSATIDMPVKRRVAGYARVSTDQEEQQTSYEAHVSYYTGYIKSRNDWEFVSVYTDRSCFPGKPAAFFRRTEVLCSTVPDDIFGVFCCMYQGLSREHRL